MLKRDSYFKYLLVLGLGISLLGSCPLREQITITSFGENTFPKNLITHFAHFRKTTNTDQLSKDQSLQKNLQERVKQLEDKIPVLENGQKFNSFIIVIALLVSFSSLALAYKLFISTSIPDKYPRNESHQEPPNSSLVNLPEKSVIYEEPPKAINQKTNKISEQISKITPSTIISKRHPNSLEMELVEIYNKNSDFLSKDAFEVTETKDSIAQHHLGYSESVVFERVDRGRGNYWILTGKYSNYLVPKKGIKFNKYNYKNVKKIFIFSHPESGDYGDFKLLQPGKVYAISQRINWQLSEQGELQFE